MAALLPCDCGSVFYLTDPTATAAGKVPRLQCLTSPGTLGGGLVPALIHSQECKSVLQKKKLSGWGFFFFKKKIKRCNMPVDVVSLDS